ncbi:hypothetical protein NQ318_020989 [Aromia moschata]|uniref:HTH psq-type domain-containing protein n=1 Tax=Aromia moschata TaxID=1265417 RepID=A0AAV8YLX3_9CUCU|nr:hypothetical protein NQ318_020989 [Aromia moschata]
MNQLNKKNQQKLQVIEYFKNGMKNKDLSEKYKVHHSAISKIIHNKDEILQRKNTAQIKILRYSSVHDSLFEKCTFLWFCQKRALGESVTGPVLQANSIDRHWEVRTPSMFEKCVHVNCVQGTKKLDGSQRIH